MQIITTREEFFPTDFGPVGFENGKELLNDGWGRIVSRKPDEMAAWSLERTPLGLTSHWKATKHTGKLWLSAVRGETEWLKKKGDFVPGNDSSFMVRI